MYPGWQPVQNSYMPQYQIVHMQAQPGWSAPIPRQPMMAGLPQAPLPQGIPPPRVEDNPPLPPEPPPADDKSEVELKPKDALEELKLQELKNKAAQWQQTLQLQQQQQTLQLQQQQQQTLQLQQQQQQTLQLQQQQQTLQLQQQQTLQLQQQWPGAPPPMMGFQTPLDFIKKEEEEFNVQYDQWKKQYDDWREQNKSHPNKEQYNLYLQQWQTYERQMEDKKADILRRKEEAKKQMREQEKAAAKGPLYAMPNPALMGMMPGSNFMGPPPPFGPPPHNFGGPPFVPRGPYGPGPPVPVGPQGLMAGRPPMPGLPMHHMHDPNAPLPGFSPQTDSKPQGPVNEADKTFNNGDQEGAGRGSVQSTDGSGGIISVSVKEVPVESGQKGSSESTDHLDKSFRAPEEKPVDNLQLLEDLLSSNNAQVNKILLRQITDDSKKVLSKLDEEGREFLTAFGTMNPAQLNKLIKVINSMGEQRKVLDDLGGLTPQILNRMKREVKDEMAKMQGSASEIIAGRSQGNGSDVGRGRGNDMGMGRGTEIGRGRGTEIGRGRGIEMGRGRGTEMGRGRGTEMGRGRGIEMSIGMENTDMDLRQGNDISQVTGGDMKTGIEMNFGQGNEIGMGRANNRGRGRENDLERGRGYDIGRGRGSGDAIHGGNNTELDLGDKMSTEMDIEDESDMEFGQVDENLFWGRNLAEIGKGNDMGIGRGNAMGRGRGDMCIEMESNLEFGFGNDMGIARGRGHDMGRGRGSDLNIGSGNIMDFGLGNDHKDIGRGRGNYMGRGSDVGRGRGNDMGMARGHDFGRGQGYAISSGSDVGMGRGIDRELGLLGNDMGRCRGNDMGRGRGNDMCMGRGSDMGRGNDMGMGRGNDMGIGRGNDMGRGRGNDMGRGRGNDMGRGRGNDVGMGRGNDMGRGRGNDMGRGSDVGMGRGNDMELWLGDEMGFGKGRDIGKGSANVMATDRFSDMARGRGNDMTRGRGNDMIRGRGNDMTRGRGNDMTRGRGNDMTRGRGNDVTRGRGNDVTRGRGNDMTRGRGNDMTRGRGGMRGGIFGRGRGVDNQGNWFAGSDQFEDVTYGESQQDFGPDSFDDNFQEPPPIGVPKGPVSLLDLNIDKPFSGNKPDGQKNEQNKKQDLTLSNRSQTFGQQPVSPGGMLGRGGPGARPRMPVRYPGPGSMMPPGMVRPAGMRHPRMMGPRGMMTGQNMGPRPLMDNVASNEPDMFQGEVFESLPENENSLAPSFEFVSPQSSIRADTSTDSLVSSATTLNAVGPAQSNDKTDIKPNSAVQGPKPMLPKLEQESSAFNQNQRNSEGPGIQQDFSQKINQSRFQEKRPDPPYQVLGGQFNQQPLRRPPQQMQNPQQSPKPLGQFGPRLPFQQQQMQGGQFFDASKQQQERDRNQRGRWGQEREPSLDSDMGNFRDQGRGRGFNRGQDIAGERFGRDRSMDRVPAIESNEPWRRGPPPVRHRQWNQEQQYNYDPQFQEDLGDSYGDEYGAGEAQEDYPEEGQGYAEPGYEDEQGYTEQGFGEREAFAEVGETEYIEEAFEYRPEVTPLLETDAGRFGEQFREPERFPPVNRFGAQEQPRDPYRQPEDQYSRLPFRDPYERPEPYRIDPYDRPDPFRDPYDPYAKRPPLDDPYRPGFGDPFYRYQPPIEDRDRDPFRLPETIDYGHMPTALLRGEKDRGFQTPAVIEYGHGQGIDKQDPVFSSRPSNLPAPEDDHRDMFREQAPPPADRNFPSPFVRGTPAGPPTTLPSGGPLPLVPKAEPKIEVVKIEDLLNSPGRNSRPAQIVVIVRGLPGSGKSYVSKLLKDKEVSKGGSAPRMLCLDDYFMIEVDKVDKDPESGKRIKKKVLEYEYEAEMESAYRQNMLKSFKKTIDDGFFPFIIVDAVFDRIKHFEEFWSYAKSKGFQVYVVELQCDVTACAKRNTHKRTQKEIEKIQHKWEETPAHYIKLDIRSLLQDDSITEVEMEDTVSEQAPPLPPPQPTEPKAEEEEEEEHLKKSKWELDLSEGNLDKLDGLQHSKKKHTVTESSQSSMEEFLQLADEYFTRQIQEPGKKRVRWADLEERKNSAYRRDLGFVVGQTHEDWQRITDPHYAERQLNKTKYF